MKCQDTKITMYTKEAEKMEKKDSVITFRTSKTIKEQLDKIAKEKEWTTSQMVEKICREYFKEKEQEIE